MRNVDKHFYEFGPFRLDLQKHRLLREDEYVPLPPKAIETLLVLVRHAGKVLEREELMQAVWADSFVEDANLSVAVSQLRKALGQNGETAEYIETIPRVGYRFVANVHEVREELAPLVVEKHTLSRTVIEEEELQPEPPAVVITAVPGQQSLQEPKTVVLRTWAFAASVIGLVFVAVMAVFWTLRETKGSKSSTASVKSIAVLPFKVVGEDSEHLGLGITDVLITRLSNIREIVVRPTSAVTTLDAQSTDSISAGRKLSVDAVLEGTLYRTNGRVRLTARLLRVSDKSTLWAGQFEKPLTDELSVQNEMALQLVDALALPLSANEKVALTKRYTESADAYNLYLKGRYQWNKRNYSGMVEAERLFRNAIESDPNFALAYVGLADTLGTTSDAYEAFGAVTKALEFDPNLGEAHATLGFLNTFHEWKWAEAEASFRKAIELNPGYATAHHWYATLLGILGRTAEAKVEMHRALELSPLSHNFLADLAQAHYFAREYKEAKEYCDRSLEIYPGFIFAHQYLSFVYLQTGEYEKMVEEDLKAGLSLGSIDNQPARPKQLVEEYLDEERASYKQGGVKKYLEHRLNSRDINIEYSAARTYAFLGDKEKALDNLEAAYRKHVFLLVFVKADPVFDNLREEPRYQIILKNMGLQ